MKTRAIVTYLDCEDKRLEGDTVTHRFIMRSTETPYGVDYEGYGEDKEGLYSGTKNKVLCKLGISSWENTTPHFGIDKEYLSVHEGKAQKRGKYYATLRIEIKEGWK